MIIKSKCEKYDIIIDKEDYNKICDFTPNGWEIKYTTGSNNPYVLTRKTLIVNEIRKRKQFYLHRLIMNVLDNSAIHVDHINRNTLDNRKENLRLATRRENMKNRSSKKNSYSKHLGVGFNKSKRGTKKFRAVITDKAIQTKNIHLGYYYDEDSAGYAYNLAAKKIHGEFANYNKIDIELIQNKIEIENYVNSVLSKLKL